MHLLLHATTCLLLYALVRRILPRPEDRFTAAASALIAAFSPAVAGAVPLRDIGMALLLIAALRSAMWPGAAMWTSLAFLAGALWCQRLAVGAVVYLPAVWLRFPDTRAGFRRGTILGLSFALLSGLFILYWALGSPSDGSLAIPTLGGYLRSLPEAPVQWLQTLKTLVWPAGPEPAAFSPLAIAVGLAAMFGWMGYAVSIVRPKPFLSTSMSWVIVAFFPSSTVFPFDTAAAGRYPYLASLGVAMILAWALSRIPDRRLRFPALAAICVWRAALAVLTP